jgi:hypothetical protein
MKKTACTLPSGNQMKSPFHRTILLLLPVLLGVHLLMLSGRAFETHLGSGIKKITTAYTSPLFPSPNPAPGTAIATSDCQLEFRASRGTGWSNWCDVSGAFGDSLNTITERIEQGLCDEFRWQVLHNLYAQDGQRRFDHIVQSSTYSKALYFIVRLEQLHNRPAADSIQLRLNYRFTPPPDQAYTFQRSYLELPPIDLP